MEKNDEDFSHFRARSSIRSDHRHHDVLYTEIRKKTIKVHTLKQSLAKEVLDDAKIETPSASGWIRHSRILSFRFLYAANPYKWHKRLKERYAETIFLPSELGEWIPLAGEQDPIFGVPAFAKADPMFGVAL